MSDEQVTSEHMNVRFDRLERQIEQVSRKSDRNHEDAAAQFSEVRERVVALETRHTGHSEEQIEQMIDTRLAVWAETHLMPMVTEALNERLTLPLKQIDGMKKDTAPIIEMAQTVQSIRRAIIWVGAPSASIAGIAGAIVIFGQVF